MGYNIHIGYRSFMGESTNEDINNLLYDISIELYANPVKLPSNAGLYGIRLSQGSNVQISNTKIQDLQLNNLEVPGLDFANCLRNEESAILKDSFGTVIDVRSMVGNVDNAVAIELGDIISGGSREIVTSNTGLIYSGNPISDAFVALSLYRQEYGQQQGGNRAFHGWVLDNYDGISYDGLPSCVSFTCNTDINDNQNEGIIGMDIDELTDVTIENIVIKRLFNKSPLSSYVCGNYTAATKGSDTKGIVINGGDVTFDGFNNVIQKLVSFNGATIGLQGLNEAEIIFDYVYSDELRGYSEKDEDTEDDRSSIQIKQLCPGHEITFALLAELMVDGEYPYPNQFYACNILLDTVADINGNPSSSISPNPPNGIENGIWCADYVPDDPDESLPEVLPVEIEFATENVDNDSNNDSTTSGLVNANNVPENIVHLGGMNNNNALENGNKLRIGPYILFGIGLICIIGVVFILVCILMKCGNHSEYKQAKYVDTDDESDSTQEYDDEDIGQEEQEMNQPI
eukprot:CAMPEP_0201596220 /NCGR_PEP_ID=MMETSP0190_2-20130828/192975_1 /ASSEMBLY_ACC=CAM_ASM_000263 /TAXON_ID=37353 /ORGANISM="Rosalina sp." /LENGTH=514 /DNA_ID=CAMNT_0048056489 /DNA_START=810 /DNA_END=2354 /DNA_ORIENTATION=-